MYHKDSSQSMHVYSTTHSWLIGNIRQGNTSSIISLQCLLTPLQIKNKQSWLHSPITVANKENNTDTQASQSTLYDDILNLQLQK